MKRQILVFLAVLFLGVGSANAQKIAHVNSDDLLKSLPEVEQADAQIKTLVDKHKTEIERQQKDLETKFKAIQTEFDAKKITQAQAQAKAKTLEEPQKKLEEYQQYAQTEVGKKRDELLNPIITKVQQAIDKVRAAKGYDYVLEASAGRGIISFNPANDIAIDVKKELGIAK